MIVAHGLIAVGSTGAALSIVMFFVILWMDATAPSDSMPAGIEHLCIAAAGVFVFLLVVGISIQSIAVVL